MLVDAAKYGDVEIPVFCYEPKLGQPVGACRMCLVEIEGIPKLQTGCSTPVKDGMVVHTQTERVHDAQRAVVEFLLINHPLDCPVCDKGGECPLQDITYGWGPGTSRFIEPKRHFRKPLELSPLIAIDRERCILCYRCVRFSQEISEDYQLILLRARRALASSSTFDGHPYVAPFSGNIVELCPVGALTSTRLPLPRAPVGHRGRGHGLHALPGAVQRRADRPRRARDARARARPRRGRRRLAVRQGPLRLPVDRTSTSASRAAACARAAADARELGEGARRRRERAEKARRAGRRAGRRRDTNEEAFLLQRLLREGLGSGHLAAAPGARAAARRARALADPALQATVPDLEFAHAVLVLDCDPVDDAPILDLRIRKGVRRHGVAARRRQRAADARSTRTPTPTLRYAPGGGEALLVALDAALARRRRQPRRRGHRRRARTPTAVRELRRRCLAAPARTS